MVEAGSHVVLERLGEQLHLAHLSQHPTGIRGEVIRRIQVVQAAVMGGGGGGSERFEAQTVDSPKDPPRQ